MRTRNSTTKMPTATWRRPDEGHVLALGGEDSLFKHDEDWGVVRVGVRWRAYWRLRGELPYMLKMCCHRHPSRDAAERCLRALPDEVDYGPTWVWIR